MTEMGMSFLEERLIGSLIKVSKVGKQVKLRGVFPTL